MFICNFLSIGVGHQCFYNSRLRIIMSAVTGCIRQGISFHSVYSVRPDKRSFTMKYMEKDPCQVVPNIPNEQISLAECTHSQSCLQRTVIYMDKSIIMTTWIKIQMLCRPMHILHA